MVPPPPAQDDSMNSGNELVAPLNNNQ